MPDEDVLSPFESMIIQYFHTIASDWIFGSFLKLCTIGDSSPKAFVIRRFGLNLTSKAVRHAAMLGSVGVMRILGRPDPLVPGFREIEELRGQFYKHAIAAVKGNCYVEILYASYMMCRFGGLNCKWEETSKHFNGFLIAFEKLITLMPSGELESLKVLYASVLGDLNIVPPLPRVGWTHWQHISTLTRLTSGNLSDLICALMRAADLAETRATCEWTAEIRLQLLQLFLGHETVNPVSNFDAYDERGLLIQASRCQLRSLSLHFESPSWQLFLHNLRSLGIPPFREVNSQFEKPPSATLAQIATLLRTCSVNLTHITLFGEAPSDTFQFGEVESALTVCRIIALVDNAQVYPSPSMQVVHKLSFRRCRIPALFLAGLILSEFNLREGISPSRVIHYRS